MNQSFANQRRVIRIGVGELTESMESSEILMIMSIVEFDGIWMVVFAYQPSDMLPSIMGIFGSVYGALSTTLSQVLSG